MPTLLELIFVGIAITYVIGSLFYNAGVKHGREQERELQRLREMTRKK